MVFGYCVRGVRCYCLSGSRLLYVCCSIIVYVLFDYCVCGVRVVCVCCLIRDCVLFD